MEELFFFIPTRSDAEKRLIAAIEELSPGMSVRVFRDADSLRRKLLSGGIRTLAAVILATTKGDLLSVLTLRELLLDFRLVMILPDAGEMTKAMAWRMWPRFVSYADGDFRDVAGVVQKIIGTRPKRKRGTSTHGREPGRNRNWSPLPLR